MLKYVSSSFFFFTTASTLYPQKVNYGWLLITCFLVFINLKPYESILLEHLIYIPKSWIIHGKQQAKTTHFRHINVLNLPFFCKQH